MERIPALLASARIPVGLPDRGALAVGASELDGGPWSDDRRPTGSLFLYCLLELNDQRGRSTERRVVLAIGLARLHFVPCQVGPRATNGKKHGPVCFRVWPVRPFRAVCAISVWPVFSQKSENKYSFFF